MQTDIVSGFSDLSLGTNRHDHISGKQDQIMLFDGGWGGEQEDSHCVCPTSLFPHLWSK